MPSGSEAQAHGVRTPDGQPSSEEEALPRGDQRLVTEPQYFRLLEKELGDVVIDVRPYKKDPAALAKTVKRLLGNETRAN